MTTAPQTTKASVLIVDDEEPVRRYVERVLETAGYRTTVAVDCAAAMAAASLVRFDLLLTDVMMPEMSGAELARRVRESDPTVKVLYLTGHTDRLFEEKVALGAQEAFLEKPCSAVALRQAVSLAITGRLDDHEARRAGRDDETCRHDFKNQLAVICGFAEILLLESGPADRRRLDFEEIHQAALTALELLGRLYPEPAGTLS